MLGQISVTFFDRISFKTLVISVAAFSAWEPTFCSSIFDVLPSRAAR